MRNPNVLFLCTANTARSQMAEALLRKHAGDHFEVYSAGLYPGVIHPFTVRVLEEAGIDASGQYAKGVKTYLGKQAFAYLITVCARAEDRCPTMFPGVGQRLLWAFDDPVAFIGSDAERMSKFREVRDRIEARILSWLGEMGLYSASGG